MKQSHKLQIYGVISRRYGRQLLGGFVLLSIFVTIDFWLGWLGAYQYVLYGLLILLAAGWLFNLVWVRGSAVSLEKKGLRLQGPFSAVVIPYREILSVQPTRMSDHFVPEEINHRLLENLTHLYEEPAIFVAVREQGMPSAAARRLLSPLLFSMAQRGLVLAAEDWVTLARNLEKIRKAVEEPPKKQGKKRPSLNDLITPGQVVGQPGNPLMLIADENQGRIKTYERLFLDQYQLIFASDGPEALRVAREFRPDCIIADHFLDRLDGMQLIVALRRTEQFKNTPILLLTDKPNARAFELGVDDVLVRPIDESDLKVRLKRQMMLRDRLTNLHRKTDHLENQTLNQMAELVRRGELINFLPQQVARNVLSGQLIDDKARLRRQKVTVLFVDMVGFTELTGRLDPPVLSDLVNEFLREMTAVSLANHGTVDKFIGDEVMVLFGAPEDQPDEVQVAHAAQTAIDMIYAVEKMAGRWERRLPPGSDLRVRIGINTGYGTAGIFGNELLRSYTVVGSVVNIAARLRAAAAPGQIVCSGECYELIQSDFQAEPLGELHLKGVAQPITAFTLTPEMFPQLV